MQSDNYSDPYGSGVNVNGQAPQTNYVMEDHDFGAPTNQAQTTTSNPSAKVQQYEMDDETNNQYNEQRL